MDAKQRKCCRCGKPTDVNPKTGKNYVMCHTCREKDSIRKKIAYHTKSEKQGRNKRGTYSAATSGSGLETIYNSAASDCNMHRCPECRIKVRNEFYYCPWCGAELEAKR